MTVYCIFFLPFTGRSLQLVATMSEDTDHIDTAACKERNIQVIKVNQVPVQTIADLTIGLLILCTQQWLNG